MSFTLFPKTIFSTTSPINGDIAVVDQFGARSLKIGGLEQSGQLVRAIWKKTLKKAHHLRGDSSPAGEHGSSDGEKNNPVAIQPFNHNVLLLGLGGGTLVPLLYKMIKSPREWIEQQTSPRECETTNNSNKAHSPGVGKDYLTAIELDPVVVTIARRYFGIKDYEDSGFLKVVVGDAFEFVSDQRSFFHPRGETREGTVSHPVWGPPAGGPSRQKRDSHQVWDRQETSHREWETTEKSNKALSPGVENYTLYPNRYTLIIVDLYLGEKFPPQAESAQFMKQLKSILAPGGMVIFNRLRTDKLDKFDTTLRQNFSGISKVKTPANLFFLAS